MDGATQVPISEFEASTWHNSRVCVWYFQVCKFQSCLLAKYFISVNSCSCTADEEKLRNRSLIYCAESKTNDEPVEDRMSAMTCHFPSCDVLWGFDCVCSPFLTFQSLKGLKYVRDMQGDSRFVGFVGQGAGSLWEEGAWALDGFMLAHRNPMGNLEFCKYKLLFYGFWACLGFFQATKHMNWWFLFNVPRLSLGKQEKLIFTCREVANHWNATTKGSWRTIGSLPSHTDSRPRFYWWVQNQTA